MMTKNIRAYYSIGFKLNAGLIYSIEFLLKPYCAAIFFPIGIYNADNLISVFCRFLFFKIIV